MTTVCSFDRLLCICQTRYHDVNTVINFPRNCHLNLPVDMLNPTLPCAAADCQGLFRGWVLCLLASLFLFSFTVHVHSDEDLWIGQIKACRNLWYILNQKCCRALGGVCQPSTHPRAECKCLLIHLLTSTFHHWRSASRVPQASQSSLYCWCEINTYWN